MISQSRVALVLAGEVLPNSKQKLVPILYTAAGGLLTTGSAYKLKAKKNAIPGLAASIHHLLRSKLAMRQRRQLPPHFYVQECVHALAMSYK